MDSIGMTHPKRNYGSEGIGTKEMRIYEFS